MKVAQLAREVGKSARVAGMLTGLRTIVTKSGGKILTIEDETGSCDITLFNRLYKEVESLLIVDQPIVILGKVEVDDYSGGARLVSEKLMTLQSLREQHVMFEAAYFRTGKTESLGVDQLAFFVKAFLRRRLSDYNRVRRCRESG